MVKVDSITFIQSQTGKTEEIHQGSAFGDSDSPAIMIPPGSSPSWAGIGTDVVAATADESVICAFTVGEIETIRAPAENTEAQLLTDYIVLRK